MYDSKDDIINHIVKVQTNINIIIELLNERGRAHDASKLSSFEKPYFDEYTPFLKDMVYGSDTYTECLQKLTPALEHHYKMNRHHPEHFTNGVKDMNLIDIVEMFCDWASYGTIEKSIAINQKRFNMSDELISILRNTIEVLK